MGIFKADQTHEHFPKLSRRGPTFVFPAGLLVVALLLEVCVPGVVAQTTDQRSLSEQIQNLTEAMARAQAQLQQSQQQLESLRAQLAMLQRQVAQNGTSPEGPEATTTESLPSSSSQDAASMAAAVQDIREQEAIHQTEIATQEQTKVESESKYPVKVTGLLLLNGFVNTKAVDLAATPTIAVPGSGSSGMSLQQTVLGIDARGPHVFGAASHADLRVDFDGNPASASLSSYSAYSNAANTLLRLRTAHAGLQWQRTDLEFSLDRLIFSPDAPSSLIAVAVPALAWSGNLWTWNPQITLAQDVDLPRSSRIRLQTGFVDVADAPLSPLVSPFVTPASALPTTGEQSRWPGVETRVALLGPATGSEREGSHLGVGGYFAPHDSVLLGRRFDSWAGSLDARLLLPGHLEFSGNSYRGQALGGLGGGAFKDFVYLVDSDTGGYYSRIVNDVGGWAQLKERLSERFEMNAAFGVDNAFARDLRGYDVAGGTAYQNLARNRTYTGNVIYNPSAYLLFSIEYRHLVSSPIVGLPAESDVVGLGAGYRF